MHRWDGEPRVAQLRDEGKRETHDLKTSGSWMATRTCARACGSSQLRRGGARRGGRTARERLTPLGLRMTTRVTPSTFLRPSLLRVSFALSDFILFWCVRASEWVGRASESVSSSILPPPLPDLHTSRSPRLDRLVHQKLASLAALLALCLLAAVLVADQKPSTLLPPRFLRATAAARPPRNMATQAYLQQLRLNKHDFLNQVQAGNDLSEWVISVGNEAGGTSPRPFFASYPTR